MQLMPETLHLAVDIIDRFLERKPVTRKNLQLVIFNKSALCSPPKARGGSDVALS
jgi:hypothetical protein